MPNAPFSASVATESIRQLADGSRITLVNRRAIARDGAGRIFQERRLLVPKDGKRESVVTQIEISDPVSHQFYICVPKELVCQEEFFSAPKFCPRQRSPACTTNESGFPSREDLGKQVIGGLETVGRRERDHRGGYDRQRHPHADNARLLRSTLLANFRIPESAHRILKCRTSLSVSLMRSSFRCRVNPRS